MGVALCQGIFAAVAVEQGRLVRPAGHALELGQPYCLTTPQRSARRKIVVAFRDWFAGECVRAVKSPALGAAGAWPRTGETGAGTGRRT